MDLARDLFRVTTILGRTSNEAMISAIAQLNYTATISQWKTKPTKPKEPVARMATIVQDALDCARAQDKRVLVYFHANWCSPCKKMLATTFQDSAVAAELEEQFILLKVDTDGHPELSRLFQVSAIPEIRILDRTGREIRQIEGFQDVQQMLAILKRPSMTDP